MCLNNQTDSEITAGAWTYKRATDWIWSINVFRPNAKIVSIAVQNF